jgi:hypothetical protein
MKIPTQETNKIYKTISIQRIFQIIKYPALIRGGKSTIFYWVKSKQV